MPKAIQFDFKSIFENAPGLNLILSPDLTIIAVSNLYLQATMTKRLDVLGHPLFKIFPDNPADRRATGVSNLSFSLNYVLENRTAHRMSIQKYDIRRPDGTFEERYWQPLNTPVFNEQNELVYIIHNVEDVTQRENAEEQIRFLAAIAKNIHDPIIATDNNYIITDWNVAAERLLEWSKEEVLGKGSVEVLKGSYPNESREQIIATLKDKGYWKGEAIYHTKSGNLVNVLTTASQIVDGEGIVTGNLTLFRDITDRKKAEVALTTLNNELEQRVKERTEDISKSEKRFRAMVENNEGIISLIDNKLKMLFCSASATRITGWTNDEFEKINASQHIHPDDIQNMQLAMNKSLQRPGENIPITIRIKHKNGHYIWLEGIINNMLHDPAIAGIITNIHDISKRKELEDLLHKSNALARLGGWEIDLLKGTVYWSAITREIHEAESSFVPNLATGINFYKEGPGRNLITQKVKEAIELGKSWDEELQIITCKNNERWIRTIGEAEFVGSKCVRVYGSFQDITERKKAEVQIQESENRYRRLFDTSPIAVTEEDHTPFYEKIESLRASGISKNYATYFHNHGEELYEMLGKVQIIGVNQRLLDLTGANNLEDFVANRSKFFVSMTEMTVFKLMDLIRDGGGYFEEETKIKSLSGEIKEVVLRLKYPAAPPYNSVAITMNDVTKQKEFEQKIIESENRMRLATSSAGMGVWYWDIKNDIMVWDKRLYQIYDIDESQLGSVNEGWLSRLHPEDKEKVNQVMQTAMAERKKQYASEFRIIRGDGSVHYIKGTGITEYDDKGDVIRMMGINWDVTETRLADEEIKNTAEQLRQLTAHLQTIREEERKRIAREIHDELGQQLTAIKMDLAWIDKKIQGGGNLAKETTSIKNKLQNLISLVDGSNESVRKILHELRHGILEDNGLLEALEWQGNQFTELTGIPVKFITNETEIELPEKIASCIFRVYQETLTNIMRYAQASKVWATLSIEDEIIIFVTEDNGKGFNINELQNSKSFGILGMKERVHSLNGVFILDSVKGKGTKIKVSLPYNTLKEI